MLLTLERGLDLAAPNLGILGFHGLLPLGTPASKRFVTKTQF